MRESLSAHSSARIQHSETEQSVIQTSGFKTRRKDKKNAGPKTTTKASLGVSSPTYVAWSQIVSTALVVTSVNEGLLEVRSSNNILWTQIARVNLAAYQSGSLNF